MKIVTIAEASEILLNDGVVAVPTETVYGLAALADSEKSIERIFYIKNRPSDNPLICHFGSIVEVLPYLKNIPNYFITLSTAFSPGPISYLLELNDSFIFKAATRGSNKIIIRIPAHPIFLELLKKVGKPIAAPSANTSGKYSSTTIEMVNQDLGDKIDGIIDGGDCVKGIESTILDCTNNNQITILRPGIIGEYEIKNILEKNFSDIKINTSNDPQIITPGSKYKHYAPKTEMEVVDDISKITSSSNIVVLSVDEHFESFKNEIRNLPSSNMLSLGSLRNESEIIRNLYSTLFKMDSLKKDKCYLLKFNFSNPTLDIAFYNRVNKMLK